MLFIWFMTKLIRVSDETHKKLTELGKMGDSYEEVIKRLIGGRK